MPFQYNGNEYALSHGSVVIAAITSCTNTSNPSVMLGAGGCTVLLFMEFLKHHGTLRDVKLNALLTGLLAKKAVECGLSVKPYIKTSLSPGSGVVTYYLKESGVMDYLSQLG